MEELVWSEERLRRKVQSSESESDGRIDRDISIVSRCPDRSGNGLGVEEWVCTTSTTRRCVQC